MKKEELDEYMKGKGPGAAGGGAADALHNANCPELAAFSALAALELPAMGLGHEDGGLLDPGMFDGDSSEYDELEDLGL